MAGEMKIDFAGKLKVVANYKGFQIETDQPVYAGGEGSAPAPFDLFLASIGTCAGYYVLSFCQKRNISVDNIYVTLQTEKNEKTKRIDRITIEVHLPEDFPEKYIGAVLKAVDSCSVKKHIIESPEFKLKAVRD